jgi:hypothetical protein
MVAQKHRENPFEIFRYDTDAVDGELDELGGVSVDPAPVTSLGQLHVARHRA